MCLNKSQMQLKAAKSGLANKFVSIKPINHSQTTHNQVAKNNTYINSQTVVEFTICKTIKLLIMIIKFLNLTKWKATCLI